MNNETEMKQQAGATTLESSPVYITAPPKKAYEKSGVNVCFALIAAVLGCWLFQFGFYGTLGFGMTVWVFLLLGFTAAWLKAKQIPVNKAGFAYLGFMVLLGIYFVLSDNTSLKLLALLILPVVYCYAVYTIAGRRSAARLEGGFIRDVGKSLFVYPFTGSAASPVNITSGIKQVRSVKKAWYFLLGILVSLPVLLIIIVLLSSDSAFSSLLQVLPDFWILDGVTVGKWILGILFSFLLFGFHYQLIYYKAPDVKEEKWNLRVVPISLALGALIPLLLIYLLFFFSQLSYFTSAFAGILPMDFTYAEYARQGFFELCIVSGINAVVMILLFLLTKGEDEQGMVLYICMTLLAVCSVSLILISLQKMRIYIGIYSLTPLRLYTSWFMLFLMICFVTAAVKIWISRVNIMKIIVFSMGLMFLVLCYADTDRLITRYNAAQYEAGTAITLDRETMQKLGASATSTLIETQNKQYSEEIERELLSRFEREQQTLWDWNLPRWQEEQMLADYWKDREPQQTGTAE